LLSVANLIGRPVVDPTGHRVGRIRDIVVRWEPGAAHPPVVGLLVKVGQTLAKLPAGEVTLTQSLVRLRSNRVATVEPARQANEVALAEDVLDHQLVDITGVQVVRAADVYLARTASGWELGGVDVGTRALLRRVFPKRRTCPPPDRALDWADLQAFVPRFPDEAPSGGGGPAEAAGLSDSSMQTAHPATELHRLRAKDVAGLLAGLDRNRQAQLAALADTSTVAQALGDLEPAKVDALLAELDDADRAKLLAKLPEGTS
jgi:sporulation protein YlmC with PRC-barrel domain